jgi:hypothetical protein
MLNTQLVAWPAHPAGGEQLDVGALYHELAARHAQEAQTALRRAPSARGALTQSAAALEDAAAALAHIARLCAAPGSSLADELDNQASGLLSIAARVPASADLQPPG